MECEEVMPPPPPPIVTDLQPESVGPLCTGEIAEFKASTSPTSATVDWTVAVNGGEPQPVQGDEEDGNILKISSKGQIKVTASLTNFRSATATWKLAELEIDVPSGPDNGRYVITDEPRMPIIPAAALGIGGPASISGQWEIDVSFTASDCPPFGPPDLTTHLHVSRTGGNQITTDFFGNVVRGGSISFSVNGTVNGCAVSAVGGAGLLGTNPQQSAIQAELPHDTLRRIACKESGQRQFDAPPNGGTGYCPLFGPGGKVGIMKIAKPTDDEVWNWRKNVAKGIELFNKNVDAARNYPESVRNSAGFLALVELFNQRRQQQGLASLQVILKNFTPLKEDGSTGEPNFNGEPHELCQLERDAIRGYNGWEGSDGFGFGMHEYRVAVDVVDGQRVLRVTNPNEQTRTGEAVWEQVPAEDRHLGEPDYVSQVLGLRPTCDIPLSPAPCKLTGITPAAVTLFIGEPREFTANGTGLADVEWSAPEGTPAAGTGPTFTAKWLKTGKKTLTATCGGITKTVKVKVLQYSSTSIRHSQTRTTLYKSSLTILPIGSRFPAISGSRAPRQPL
jgi:hypothetical protein